jgi:hypothetical protein
MDLSVLEKIYPKYEEIFLTDKGKEWGWQDLDAIIFVQRMLLSNWDLPNDKLEDVLNLKPNRVADTLSRKIYARLKVEGCGENHWRVAQKWLKDEVFPKWVKGQQWKEMWQQAELSQNITIETETLPGAFLKAGVRVRAVDRIEIPQVKIGSNVNYEVAVAADQFFILLEKDENDAIGCLAPSRVFPRFEISEPVAREQLLAIVSSREPQLSWLAAARQDFVEVDTSMLAELRLWVEGNQDCQLCKREFDIIR